MTARTHLASGTMLRYGVLPHPVSRPGRAVSYGPSDSRSTRWPVPRLGALSLTCSLQENRKTFLLEMVVAGQDGGDATGPHRIH